MWEEGRVRALPTAPFLDGIVGGGPGPAGNNDKGQVVGQAGTCNLSAIRQLIWEDDKVIDMGTLGGLPFAPVSINNRGQATGTGSFPTNAGLNRGFLWQNGVAIDLGSLPGYPQVHGNTINDSGQIAGQTCVLDESSCTVFLWQNGVMTDLNTVVPADSSLYMIDPGTINSRGEIVGLALQKTIDGLVCCRAFLATPDNSGEAGSSTATAVETSRTNIVLPENIRKMLQQRLGNRYHISRIGVEQQD
jgi:probable HAF family extracellular repeat protein